MDLNQLAAQLKGVPDQALQQELVNPSGVAPSYLVLAEAQRRSLMRQAAQQQQAERQKQSGWSTMKCCATSWHGSHRRGRLLRWA
jgi:hypothetical protein